MGEKSKNYVMSVEEAKNEIEKGLKTINESYRLLKDLEETTNGLNILIKETFQKIFNIYKANRNRLPEKARFKFGRYHVHLGTGKVVLKKGVSLESLKDNLLRRTLIVVFRGRTKNKIEKIQDCIKELFRKQRVNTYKIKLTVELNKEKIKRHPKIIEGLEEIKIVRKKFFKLKPIGLRKAPSELIKEFD